MTTLQTGLSLDDIKGKLNNGPKPLRKAAKDQGWTFVETKKGQAWIPPDSARQRVQIHHTPSDRRTLKNFLSELKRQGLIWPWPPKPPKKGDK